ncbi:hypothetical protein CSUB01_12560 [Colletotrichum sublineola]|uniref:Uncharacterized protein n=1 Tax=Colletotrichum sublineola TaxID=1173701 RepID=A0A066WUH0_COLSU|nr:hypothetical protein CSUB01_12560 [Colletotrichum sublineola]
MAPVTSHEVVFTYDKKAKEKVRKCGGSAKRKAVQLGLGARVFSAVVHFNPTYGKLDGAVYVPQGQSIPNVNQFVSVGNRQVVWGSDVGLDQLAELANGMHGVGGQRRLTRRRRVETPSDPVQVMVEASDNKAGELTGRERGEGDTSSAEDAEANEESDAPHELEADENGVADTCGVALGAHQGDTRLDEEPMDPSQHEVPKETALLSEAHDDDMTEDFVMVDTSTAAEADVGAEASFIDLLGDGMHDLFGMVDDTNTRFGVTDSIALPTSGPADSSEQEDRQHTDMTDWEIVDVEETRGDTAMANTAETSEKGPGNETKIQETPTAAVAPVIRPARNTQKIHRFFWQVSKQIRLAKRKGDFDVRSIRQVRLGVQSVRHVGATVQSRGNRKYSRVAMPEDRRNYESVGKQAAMERRPVVHTSRNRLYSR